MSNSPNFIHFCTALYLPGNTQLLNPRCKFKIDDYQDLTNPILKIYTINNFGSRVELFTSTLIENLVAHTAETSIFFAPSNNDIDGFCRFELYDGSNLVQIFESSYAVLYKRRQAQISTGNFYTIDYAVRFFYNHPSGTGVCNSYLDNLGSIFNQVWVEQVVQWQLNNGHDPAGTGSYELSLNPYQDETEFLFLHNEIRDGQVLDMFQTYTLQRHISFTANPTAYIDYTNTQYTENEFIKSGLHHEFYHGMQYTFNTQLGSSVDFFWILEGQARAIQSIGEPNAEFRNNSSGLYNIDANKYIYPNLSLRLKIKMYFARPYHSWERGANENLNGLIRKYFPKGCDLEKVTPKQIKEVEQILNCRPRKRHNFDSPYQKFQQLTNINPVALVT